MSIVVIQICGFCKTLFCNTTGCEFEKVPLDQLKATKKQLESDGNKVSIVKETAFPRKCPSCREASKKIQKGRPSSKVLRKHIPDHDANGSWGNSIRTVEKG